MSRITLIHHVNVQISDRARTRDWYVKVLGAEFLDRSTLAHLDALGIPHVRTTAAATRRNIGGTDPHQGRREDTGEHYTYIHDPDGNMIELVYHPLGLEDVCGRKVEVAHDTQLRWTQIPGFVAAAQRA